MLGKENLIIQIEQWLEFKKLTVQSKDIDKPWGAYWQIDQSSLENFMTLFSCNTNININVNPKILLVEPKKRLSLQYHNRRSEKWAVLKGPVKIILDNNELICTQNQEINIPSNTNHRLCGLNNYGLIAEIWIHNDLNNKSDEDDIVRIEDDFNRL